MRPPTWRPGDDAWQGESALPSLAGEAPRPCPRKVWHGGETQANEQHDEDEATEESEPSSGDEDRALGQGDALALVRAILGRGQGNFHLQAA